MIIYLYGPDSYRRRKKLKEIIGEYQGRHSNLSLERFDLEEADELIRFQEFAANRSMFESVKMAVAENLFGGEANKKEMKKLLESYLKTKDAILVISEEKTPPEEFKFLLKKPTRPVASDAPSDYYGVLSQEFANLKGERLKFFIQKEARLRGVNLTPAAIGLLAKNYQGNTWGLMTELDKISLAGRKSVDVKDLWSFGDFRQPPDIFQFINLFITKFPSDYVRRLLNLEILLSAREEPAKIFNILASRSRSPRLLNKMADYDIAVKSGKLGYEEALLDLCLE